MRKRVLACLTALVLALGCFPATAFAKAEPGIGSSSVTEQNSTWHCSEVKFDHKTYSITTPHNMETVTYKLTASLAANPANLSLKNGESADLSLSPSLENTAAKTVSDRGFRLGFKLVRGSYTDTYYDIQRIEYTFTPKGQGETVRTTITYPLDGNHKLEGVGSGYWVDQQFILGAGGGNRVDLKPGTSYKVSVKVYTRDRNNNERDYLACPKVENFGSVTIPEAYTAEIGKTDLVGNYLTFDGNDDYGVNLKSGEVYTVTKLQNNNASAVLTAQLHLKDGTVVATADVAVNGTRQNTVTFRVDDSAKGAITAGTPVQSVYGAGKINVPTVTAKKGWTFAGWAKEGSDTIVLPADQKTVKAPLAADVTYVAQFARQTNTVTFFYINSETNQPLGQVTELVGDQENTVTLAQDQHTSVPVGGSFAIPEKKTLVGYVYGGITDYKGAPVSGDSVLVENMAAQNVYTISYTPASHQVVLRYDTAAGTVEQATLTVPHNGRLTAPAFQANDGYRFDGWQLDGRAFDFETRISDELTLQASTTHLSYTVTFLPGEHGTVSGDAQQTIYHGEAAVAPQATPDEGWLFAGWDADFSNVTGELTVTALYNRASYTVTFLPGEHGTVSGDAQQTVYHGEAAVAPQATPDEGWLFAGWDADFSNVTGELTVTALYNRASYTVTFLPGEHGTVSGDAQQTIHHGEAAVAPQATPDEGWLFAGWDADFSNVTGELTVTALWRERETEEPVNPNPPAEEESPVGPVNPADPTTPTDPTVPASPTSPVTPAVTPNPPVDNAPVDTPPADQVIIPDSETPQAQAPVDGPTEEILDNEIPQAQAPGTDRMTLLDLIGAAVALILAIAGAVSKKRTLGKKGILAGIATLLVVLFFVTQPMVWRFRIADIWTIFFAVGIAAQAFTLFFKKDEEEEEAQENR